jgi:hypothetical protein
METMDTKPHGIDVASATVGIFATPSNPLGLSAEEMVTVPVPAVPQAAEGAWRSEVVYT